MVMRYIPNELGMVDKWFRTKSYHDKPTVTIDTLAKYYRDIESSSMRETCAMIHSHLESGYSGYLYEDWCEKVEKSVGRIYKQKTPISNVTSVEITSSEIEKIRSLNNEKLERITFTMLVLLKIKHKIKSSKDSNWVEDGNATIFKLANVKRLSDKDKGLLMHELVTLGYMRQSIKPSSSNSALNRELFYVDYDSPTAITITDFENFILDYDKYIGVRVIECGNCGKRLIPKGNKTKYCKDCAKVVKHNSTIKSVQKSRNNRKK